MHNLDLVLTLTGGLAAALVLGYGTQRLGLSPIVGYLLGGIAVGPHTPGFVADGHLAEQFAEVGVILLMFGVGLHFHVRELLAVRRIALPGAVVQCVSATVLGTIVGLAFGWTWPASIVFGLAISIASTVVLTRVLFPDAEQVPLGEGAEAKLLIGDAALKSAFEDPTPHHDLGRLWLERTGLPMVFAVWAAPLATAERLGPGLLELEEALVNSLRAARANPEQLAHESAERYGYPAGFLARYFEKLRYRFGPRERAGLYTFLELARDVGELDEVPELRFVTAAATV